jgi:hypothetical protein
MSKSYQALYICNVVFSTFCDWLLIYAEFQQDAANAKPWLSCVLYDDFVKSKEVSLVRSDFLPSLTKPVSCIDINLLSIFHAFVYFYTSVLCACVCVFVWFY